MNEGPPAADPGGPSRIVFDTTVLSNYARSDGVDWLTEVVSVPVTVSTVRDELAQGIDEGHDFLQAAVEALVPIDSVPAEPRDSIAVVSIPESSRSGSRGFGKDLDPGEARALHCAEPDGVLATDDLDARQLATKRGVEVTGSIGLLAYGVQRGDVSTETADEWLGTWRSAGYYSPVESVAELSH